MKKIYMGIWADILKNGEELPVGHSIFRDEHTIKLTLDFDSFNGQLGNYLSSQKVSELYEQKQQKVTDWLTKVNSKIDPYLFLVAKVVQRKVQDLMNVKPKEPPNKLERQLKFKDDNAKLSDLRGVAMCAEQASLGQYLLQNVLEDDYFSSYMGGVEAQYLPPELTDHSFIVVRDPDSKTYIFDIARPLYESNLPRILETDVPFNYKLFGETKNLLVGATDVLQGGRLYFGVGHPMLQQEPEVIGTRKLK